MNKCVVLICAFLLVLGGCSDFLEEESKELSYVKNCADLEELLVGGGYMKKVVLKENEDLKVNLKEKTAVYFPWLQIMDDDVNEAIAGQEETSNPLTKLRAFYNWEKDPCNIQGVLYNDPTWGRLYEHIAVVNVALDKVGEFSGEKETVQNSVIGQCYFLRAAYYFLLVNFYAKPYDPASASMDPGVPIKLTPWVEDADFERASVEKVYEQIVEDLKKAIDCLKGIQMSSFYHANEYAARTFLSRVYCYMGKWDLVPDLCREVLKGNYMIKDLTTAPSTSSWVDNDSPEIIFSQGSNATLAIFTTSVTVSHIGCFRISDELMEIFAEEPNDCRPGFLYQKSGEFVFPRKTKAVEIDDEIDFGQLDKTKFVSDNFLIRLSEVYLNLAEALAMTEQEDEARETLKMLMEKRISPSREITESGEDLVKLIRKERRKELCFEGHRWLDLRRYAVSPLYPDSKSIKHNRYYYNATTNKTPGAYAGYYRLPAYPDGGWVLPIPSAEIEQTHGSLINNQRENCLFYEE